MFLQDGFKFCYQVYFIKWFHGLMEHLLQTVADYVYYIHLYSVFWNSNDIF